MRTISCLFKTFLLLLFMVNSFGQTSKSGLISGTVYDENDKPVAGVEIINLNNNFVALSQSNGTFAVKGEKGDRLRAVYSGKQITVTVADGKNTKIKFQKEVIQKEKTPKKGKKSDKSEYKTSSDHAKNGNPYKNSLIGTITDADGFPVSDAEVVVRGTSVSTFTDENGQYGIDAKMGDVIMVTDLMGTTEEFVVNNAVMNLRIGGAVLLESVTLIGGISISAGYAKEKASSESSVFIRGATSISESASAEMPASESYKEGIYNSEGIKAGQLTAGEVNDFSSWEYWQGLTENELNQWKNHWQFSPACRYSVVLTNEDGFPVINKKVYLTSQSGKKLWTSKTDNTGRAELWYNPNDVSTQAVSEKLSIVDDSRTVISRDAIEFKNGINFYRYNTRCDELNKVNIAFMVDATGSMSDELSYLQAELYDVIERAKKELRNVNVTMGSVFYRDNGDEYVVKNFDFNSDISSVTDFIKKQSASGGGDYPEAVVEAFEATIGQLSWDDDARSKLLFVLLDAPPHYDTEKVQKLQELAKTAAEKGIRIIPVAASGIDKSTEFLMRAITLETNGTYLFLTDHSGIGNPHIEPSAESYKVEMFNDMLLRIILQFTEVRNCKSNDNYPENKKIEEKISGSGSIKWAYFPNPASGLITVETDREAQELYLFDTTGKLVLYRNEKAMKYQLNLSGLPTAVYYLKVVVDGKELYGKFIKR